MIDADHQFFSTGYIPLRCDRCGRRWVKALTLPEDVDVFVAMLKVLTKRGCRCGEKKRILMGNLSSGDPRSWLDEIDYNVYQRG